MIDPASISTMAVGGFISDKVQEHVHKILGDGDRTLADILCEQSVTLHKILEQLSVADNPDITEFFTLQTFAESYTVPSWKRNHLCALLPGSISIVYQVPGMTVITRTITNGGWYQLDLPQGTIIAASATSPILLRWCDYAIGAAF